MAETKVSSFPSSPDNAFNKKQFEGHSILKRGSGQLSLLSSHKNTLCEGIVKRQKKKPNVTFKNPRRIENLLQSRVYSAYAIGTKDPTENYQPRISNREWWRPSLNATPVPGYYNHRDFLEEENMKPIQVTYNFLGQGRKKKSISSRSGDAYVPGSYEHRDFVQDILRKRSFYSFKNTGRKKRPIGLAQDKDVNIPPCHYDIQRYPKLIDGPNLRLTSSFRSQSDRSPSSLLLPNTAPPPGAYDPTSPVTRFAVSSCFRSQTARMKKAYDSNVKVPGPGTYNPDHVGKKLANSINKMGRMHGLYFRNTFET